jgi:hypothetical protein
MEVEDAEIGQRRRVRETLQHTVEVACVSQILQTQRRPLAARHRARLPSDEERWQKGRSSHVWCTSRLSGPTRGGSTQKGSIARPCNRQDIPAHALRRCFTHPPAPPPVLAPPTQYSSPLHSPPASRISDQTSLTPTVQNLNSNLPHQSITSSQEHQPKKDQNPVNLNSQTLPTLKPKETQQANKPHKEDENRSSPQIGKRGAGEQQTGP